LFSSTIDTRLSKEAEDCTESPSESPTDETSVSPSKQLSASPTEEPSVVPSVSPSASPTEQPSEEPSVSSSEQPSKSVSPSEQPSEKLSTSPSESVSPSEQPSGELSVSPSEEPQPSEEPSEPPSKLPEASESPSEEQSVCVNDPEFPCEGFLQNDREEKCFLQIGGQPVYLSCPEICPTGLCTCEDREGKFTVKVQNFTFKLTCDRVKDNGWCGFDRFSAVCPVTCERECLN